jgi:D-glycero-D-manno-heptose 1,7-bisphosphate phosphatase
LDRDGVLIENRDDYVRSWSDVEILSGAVEACARVNALGLPLVLITNQAVIGRGILAAEEVIALNQRILSVFADNGAPFLDAYICPHHPNDGCDCRKPKPGMILRAAKEHSLDLGRSVVIGDNLTDLGAADAAGVRGVLVRTGLGADFEQALAGRTAPLEVYDDLAQAIDALFPDASISRP